LKLLNGGGGGGREERGCFLSYLFSRKESISRGKEGGRALSVFSPGVGEGGGGKKGRGKKNFSRSLKKWGEKGRNRRGPREKEKEKVDLLGGGRRVVLQLIFLREGRKKRGVPH